MESLARMKEESDVGMNIEYLEEWRHRTPEDGWVVKDYAFGNI